MVFILNHTDKLAAVTLSDSYVDAFTGEPAGQSLELGSREVKILDAG